MWVLFHLVSHHPSCPTSHPAFAGSVRSLVVEGIPVRASDVDDGRVSVDRLRRDFDYDSVCATEDLPDLRWWPSGPFVCVCFRSTAECVDTLPSLCVTTCYTSTTRRALALALASRSIDVVVLDD